jgi:DNA-nicking Smr family endonuclease
LPDWHLWNEVARTVRPFGNRPLVDLTDEPLPLPGAADPAPRKLSRIIEKPTYQSDGRPGRPAAQEIEPRLLRRVVRGRIEIDGTIDLHGMRQAEAHAALSRFIHSAVSRGHRTILVITGKGLKKLTRDAGVIVDTGVLRVMLPIWLRESALAPLIAGWEVSAQGHGGEGAFYLRLRRTERHR